jgi:hypothetical protein
MSTQDAATAVTRRDKASTEFLNEITSSWYLVIHWCCALGEKYDGQRHKFLMSYPLFGLFRLSFPIDQVRPTF